MFHFIVIHVDDSKQLINRGFQKTFVVNTLSSRLLEAKINHNQTVAQLYLAYSGGIDSHVLLHLCASIDSFEGKLTAVYINHGLQVEAKSWGLHCEQVCINFGVNFLSLTVNAQAALGESPEEAARNARYSALKGLLAENDVLLVAQHAEDQLESVLLQLFRGSGLKGLSGMPESMVFGKGKLIRPLLGVSKAAVVEYAKIHGLSWVEDPSNNDSKYARNFLRNEIIPKLKQQWPGVAKTVSRSAQHCANAESLLALFGENLFAESYNPIDSTLQINRLLAYSNLQQHMVLREWFQQLGLKLPSYDAVNRIVNEVVDVRVDANPTLVVQGYEIRRFRDKLYCINSFGKKHLPKMEWPTDASQLHIADDLTYGLTSSTCGISSTIWANAKVTVKFRVGGESIRLPGRQGQHKLKNLFQEVGVPPWERSSIPLIFMDGQLAAVGDLWVSADFYMESGLECLAIIRIK